jgi:hypothetical protein
MDTSGATQPGARFAHAQPLSRTEPAQVFNAREHLMVT